MITGAMLDVYARFNGDVDMWQRRGTPGSDVISGHEWGTIRVLLQELAMYKRGVVSDRYATRIRTRLAEITSDPETAARLLDMA
jgi:hypothetical protein